MSSLRFPSGRTHDLACLGRLAVDLYAQQLGSRLEDARSFSRYLGGSSANLAFGVARLGCKSAMISRVGQEQMGRYLMECLQAEGCDTSQVQIDPERLSGLVLLGLKDRETFPLLFYRGHGPGRAGHFRGLRGPVPCLGHHGHTPFYRPYPRSGAPGAAIRAPPWNGHGAGHRLPPRAVGPDGAGRG